MRLRTFSTILFSLVVLTTMSQTRLSSDAEAKIKATIKAQKPKHSNQGVAGSEAQAAAVTANAQNAVNLQQKQADNLKNRDMSAELKSVNKQAPNKTTPIKNLVKIDTHTIFGGKNGTTVEPINGSQTAQSDKGQQEGTKSSQENDYLSQGNPLYFEGNSYNPTYKNAIDFKAKSQKEIEQRNPRTPQAGTKAPSANYVNTKEMPQKPISDLENKQKPGTNPQPTRLPDTPISPKLPNAKPQNHGKNAGLGNRHKDVNDRTLKSGETGTALQAWVSAKKFNASNDWTKVVRLVVPAQGGCKVFDSEGKCLSK